MAIHYCRLDGLEEGMAMGAAKAARMVSVVIDDAQFGEASRMIADSDEPHGRAHSARPLSLEPGFFRNNPDRSTQDKNPAYRVKRYPENRGAVSEGRR
jgi:hypothetical protein